MSLKKDYVRDGKRSIIGSVTTGFDDTTAVVRGNLVSINSPDPGLLLRRRK